jgi:hypothetical protein
MKTFTLAAHLNFTQSRILSTLTSTSILQQKGTLMLWTIFVVLLLLWALGMVTSTTLGGFIHLLLLIAVAVVLIRIIQGRPVV